MSAALASIPSPSSGSLDLGPVEIHLYGLTLLVAIVLCTYITGRRWVARGGDWDLIFRCAVWGVAAGIVGARLYHVVTSWDQVGDPKWQGVFEIWKGGLGIWGGIAAGVVVGALIARRAGADTSLLADSLAPGLLVAQAVGRLGNWWNQELFGKPTDLPWALEIDPEKRPVTSLADPTYHPTFLYELLWNLGVAAFLVFVLERRFRVRPPGLFAAYVSLYSFGRFWIELLRVDPAHEIAGLRLNAWVSALVFVAGLVWFVRTQRRGGGGGARRARPPRRRRLRREPRPPKRPAMTVPKGRVRPGG